MLSTFSTRKQCGFRTVPTQTELCKHRRWLEAENSGFRKVEDVHYPSSENEKR